MTEAEETAETIIKEKRVTNWKLGLNEFSSLVINASLSSGVRAVAEEKGTVVAAMNLIILDETWNSNNFFSSVHDESLRNSKRNFF